jgi:tetratricopeptide (TPR) repeat protein
MKKRKIHDADDFNYCGEMKYYDQDYQGAIQDFTKAIELESEDPDIFINRGLAKLMEDNKNEALRDFCRAIELGERVPYKVIELCR